VYHFDPRLEDIFMCNRPTLLFLSFMGMALIWCIITIDFGHTSTGLGGAALVLSIAYAEIRDRMLSAARELHDINPLLTNELITKAKQRAESRQYSGAQAEVPEPLRSVLRTNHAPRKEWLAKVRAMRIQLGLLGIDACGQASCMKFSPLHQRLDLLNGFLQGSSSSSSCLSRFLC
jgi:hypothetical protein